MKTRLFWCAVLVCFIAGWSSGCALFPNLMVLEAQSKSRKDTTPPVSVSMGRADLELGQEVIEYISDDGPYSVEVLFTTSHSVRDFKFLELSDGDFDADGELFFTITEAFHRDTMTPDSPILVRLVFIGTIPNNGFSYIDASGAFHRFTLNLSGEDGSLMVIPF